MEQHMSTLMDDEIKRWTARRKSAPVCVLTARSSFEIGILGSMMRAFFSQQGSSHDCSCTFDLYFDRRAGA
jgi:hypothetical protein